MTRPAMLVAIGLVATAALEACSDARQPAAPLATAGAHPVFDASECKPPLPDNQIPLPIAPAAQRVDLGTPIFKKPTTSPASISRFAS